MANDTSCKWDSFWTTNWLEIKEQFTVCPCPETMEESVFRFKWPHGSCQKCQQQIILFKLHSSALHSTLSSTKLLHCKVWFSGAFNQYLAFTRMQPIEIVKKHRTKCWTFLLCLCTCQMPKFSIFTMDVAWWGKNGCKRESRYIFGYFSWNWRIFFTFTF